MVLSSGAGDVDFLGLREGHTDAAHTQDYGQNKTPTSASQHVRTPFGYWGSIAIVGSERLVVNSDRSVQPVRP